MKLPNEVWCEIFANVEGVRDKIQLRLTCKQFKHCVDDGQSWKYAYCQISPTAVNVRYVFEMLFRSSHLRNVVFE
jgi:hypothetical protein